MKYEIMLRILFELLSKRFVKAQDLAYKFEVSVRTIHRYINCLELSGIPIYTERGSHGGFAIMDSYKFSSTFMTENEFKQTIEALTAITDSVPNKDLDSVINKLKSASKNNYSSLDLKSGNLIIDAGPWGDAVGYKSKLAIIQKSIEQNKKLAIRYHDRNGDVTERTISPHVIVFKQGIWYVFAHCDLRNEFRFFKTGRIEYATVTDESFIRQNVSEMDLPLNFWHDDLPIAHVIMEIDKQYVSDVEEWLGIEHVNSINGKFTAEVDLPFDKGLVTKIMSFGSGIKVIEPKELKDEIKKNAKNIIKNYE
jgi:predicted DNA-binding transcriptional regulator YafY